MAARAEVVGDLLGGGHGEAVDDPRAGLLGEVVGQPGQPLLGRLEPDHPEPQRLAVQRAAQHEDVSPGVGAVELLGHVRGHPGVGGRRGGQHGDAVGELAEEGADPAVVGPEVVAPVGDAVRLVDDEEPAGRGEPGQHLVAEAGVVEPLRAHEEYVDLPGPDRLVDGLPVLDVRRVDRHRADAGPLGGGDLVAHQGQQRGDDHGRARTGGAQQQGGHEVDRRLAPAGPLHDQRPPPVDGQRRDRRPLVLAEDGVLAADERAQVCLGLGPDVGGGYLGCGHPHCLPAVPDSPPVRRVRGCARRPPSPSRRAAP